MADKVPKVMMKLTASGIQMDLLGALGKLIELNKAGEHQDVHDHLVVMAHILVHAALGDQKWIEDNYEASMVEIFRSELDASDPVRLLLDNKKEGKSE